MKLLYVHNADFSGIGANKIQVMNMCEAFSKIEISITLLGFGRDKEKIWNSYNIKKRFNLILLKRLGNYYLRSGYLFFNFIKIKDKFDNIFTRDLIFAYLVKTFFKEKKVIYELHDIPNQKLANSFLIKIFYYLTFKKVDGLILTNRLLFKKYKKYINCNYKILPNGINIENFKIKINKKKIISKYNIPKDKLLVSYIGGFQNYKGIPTIIKAAENIKNEKILFILVGGKLNNNYKNIININKVNQDEAIKIMKISDILMLPNSGKNEVSSKLTSPLKLFEYMAAKKPIIASNVPAIKNIVSKEEVLFFKSDNYKDLINKIIILIRDKRLQKKITRNAFKKVKGYTWKKRAKKIVELLKNDKN